MIKEKKENFCSDLKFLSVQRQASFLSKSRYEFNSPMYAIIGIFIFLEEYWSKVRSAFEFVVSNKSKRRLRACLKKQAN